jgi:hypothetical protein
MQINLLARTSHGDQPASKLSLKKETLRQLTSGELRQAAGGGTSISLTPSTSVASGTSVIHPTTSISPSTSAVGSSVSAH